MGMVPALPSGKLAYPLPLDYQPQGNGTLPDGVALVQIEGMYYLAPLDEGTDSIEVVRRAYLALGYRLPE